VMTEDPTGYVVPVLIAAIPVIEAAAAAAGVTFLAVGTGVAANELTKQALRDKKESDRLALLKATRIAGSLDITWTFANEDAVAKTFTNVIIQGRPMTAVEVESRGLSLSKPKSKDENGKEEEAQAENKSGTKAKDSSKGERHGDDGRAIGKVQKQINDLLVKLEKATRREAQKIKKKIENLTKDAQRKKKGETHWRR